MRVTEVGLSAPMRGWGTTEAWHWEGNHTAHRTSFTLSAMEVFIVVADRRSGESYRLMLDAAPQTTFSELVPRLAEFIEGNAEWAIDGNAIDPSRTLDQIGVRDGLVIEALEPGRVAGAISSPAQPDEVMGSLRVVKGPDTGLSWPLKAGPDPLVLGRSRTAAFNIPSDGEVSRIHADLRVNADGIVIADLKSSNGTIVRGATISQPTALVSGDTIQLGETTLAVSITAGRGASLTNSGNGVLTFNRPPRIPISEDATRLSVPTEPEKRQATPMSVASIVAPLLIAAVMAVFLQPMYLLFGLLSPMMLLGNYVTDRRRGSRSHRKALADYQERKSAFSNQLQAAIDRETMDLRQAAPDPSEVAAIASAPQARLWERRPSDGDFLALRVGIADQPASVQLSSASSWEPAHSSSPDRPVLKQVPVTVDLASSGVFGVCGDMRETTGILRWLTVQVAALHAPEEVRIVVLAPDDQQNRWDWAMWLPHARMNQARYVAGVALDQEAVESVASSLAVAIDSRLQRHESPGPLASLTGEVATVVVIADSTAARSSPAVARVLNAGPSVGIYAICLAERNVDLPEDCKAILTVEGGAAPTVSLRRADRSEVKGITPDKVGAGTAEDIARALAPLRLDRRHQTTLTLPTSVSLVELLNLDSLVAETIVARWDSQSRNSAAVVGVTSAGPLAFDLPHQGPHGLVAGTPNSGKSEFLRSLIASLAVANRPDTLTFVLVDYKGGSAFQACSDLPHVVGVVTDLDGHQTARALASLGAEVHRREIEFQKAGNAKDIEAYWRRQDEGHPKADSSPMPRLLIVIDELAYLADELPAFVEGLVDLSRRGRSYGVHLLLATQRPAGVVTPAIKANTNLRVCMRVTDASESSDVIDSPLAARIPATLPGRGYIRIGHDQLTEFQAAQVGGRRSDAHQERSVRLYTINPRMLATPLPRQDEKVPESDSELSALVAAIRSAADRLAIPAIPPPWLDPLPDHITLQELPRVVIETDGFPPVPFALEDFPDEQAQRSASFRLDSGGNLYFVGDSSTDRSNALITLAGSAAAHTTAGALHIYGLDCGSGALLGLAELPHCGGVATKTEVERVDRLITLLGHELRRRQSLLAGSGFASVAEQRSKQPTTALPYILVLLDSWEGFILAFGGLDADRLTTAFQQVLREGPEVGIKCAVTGDRGLLVGRMASLAETRLLMRLNDRTMYSAGGLSVRSIPDEIGPGRAFRGDSGSELQIASLSADTSGTGRATAIREIANRAASEGSRLNVERLPEPLGVLPDRLDLEDLIADVAASKPFQAVVGVGGNRLGPVTLDLLSDGPAILVTGPRKTGRSTALASFARSLLATNTQVIVVVSPLASPLRQLAGTPGVLGVLAVPKANASDLDTLLEQATGPIAVVVDDAEQIVDSSLGARLQALLIDAVETDRAVVLGCATDLGTAAVRGLIAEARKSRSGFVLSPSTPADGELLGVRLPKTALFRGPAGRAVHISNGEYRIIQFAEP